MSTFRGRPSWTCGDNVHWREVALGGPRVSAVHATEGVSRAPVGPMSAARATLYQIAQPRSVGAGKNRMMAPPNHPPTPRVDQLGRPRHEDVRDAQRQSDADDSTSMFFPAPRLAALDAPNTLMPLRPHDHVEPADLLCRRCLALLVPSRRRPWDWIPQAISGRSPFRCPSCLARYWRRVSISASK